MRSASRVAHWISNASGGSSVPYTFSFSELGVYGFRNRRDHSYDGLRIVNSTAFAGAEPVWDTLGRYGIRSIVLAVPGTFPPRPIAGALVSGFLTPDTQAAYTYPASLAERIRDWVGEYVFDVRQFRTDDKVWLSSQVREMTEKRFTVALRLVAEREWRFFAMVEIGPDRIHHGMWSHHDPTHRHHDAASPYQDTLREYYRFLDQWISRLLNELPSSTEVLVVSDHGAQKMEGGVAINEWLIRNNYLTLTEYPDPQTRMQDLIERGQVDWSRTTAWGEGGYCGRLFLNVAGREPDGIVPQQEYDRTCDRLSREIASIPDDTGTPLGSRVQRPEELYRTVAGIPPDLLVYFGDLRWRSIGTVGWNKIHIHENDTGPDDANHSLYGVYISSTPGRSENRRLLDIRQEILEHFEIKGQT